MLKILNVKFVTLQEMTYKLSLGGHKSMCFSG